MDTEAVGKHSHTYSFIDPEKFKGTLKGKVALVIGAGRGIGRAITIALAQAGASIACVSRTQTEIDQVVEFIIKVFGSQAMAVAADVAMPEAPKVILNKVHALLGAVDMLVNNAGIFRYNTLEHEKDFETWWWVVGGRSQPSRSCGNGACCPAIDVIAEYGNDHIYG
ncbi:NAD(P)-binding protein [Mollisia scopiformis]|uniref:NAD(P)-binding protein n=1 Tax=Mollisia scopiformis TaxID=149040 RepID=A0A194X6B3_MOLSC|nr:NAD(P)-binding protein [Mollisia scopiformis]KUJ15352.1 NAD(P)-binding protein [Mollisia scopiformis]